MIIEELVTGRNLSLAGGIVVVVMVFRQLFPAAWKTPLGKRVLPVLPILLGVLGAIAGMAEAASWQDRVVVGLLAGYVAAHSFQVGKTSVLGYGTKLPKTIASDSSEAVVGSSGPKE